MVLISMFVSLVTLQTLPLKNLAFAVCVHLQSACCGKTIKGHPVFILKTQKI